MATHAARSISRRIYVQAIVPRQIPAAGGSQQQCTNSCAWLIRRSRRNILGSAAERQVYDSTSVRSRGLESAYHRGLTPSLERLGRAHISPCQARPDISAGLEKSPSSVSSSSTASSSPRPRSHHACSMQLRRGPPPGALHPLSSWSQHRVILPSNHPASQLENPACG